MENIYKTVSSIGYRVYSKDKIQERTRIKKRLYRVKKEKEKKNLKLI